MSMDAFLSAYPSGRIPRQSPDWGKTFVCRRACNTRTATYTDEFIWEEMYKGGEDVYNLINMVKEGTKATRRRRNRSPSPTEAAYQPPQTPSKTGRSAAATPSSRRTQATPGSRSTKK
jgi:origin recognition complex subunit 1